MVLLAGCGDPVTVDVAGKNMMHLARGTRAQWLEALAQIPTSNSCPPPARP